VVTVPHDKNKPTFICGGDDTPGDRGTECPNALHDHPLPSGYVDAAAAADRRLRSGNWRNKRCPECGTYGWEGREDDAPPEEVRGVVQSKGRIVGGSMKGLESQGRIIR
jgi:hypothetical protein